MCIFFPIKNQIAYKNSLKLLHPIHVYAAYGPLVIYSSVSICYSIHQYFVKLLLFSVSWLCFMVMVLNHAYMLKISLGFSYMCDTSLLVGQFMLYKYICILFLNLVFKHLFFNWKTLLCI